jgi:hypothetical protein
VRRSVLTAALLVLLVQVVGALTLTRIPDGPDSLPPGGRVPTASAPLRVLVVGDSVMFDTEPALRAALAAAGPSRVESRSVFGFGLSRPEYYDWRAKWPRFVSEARPDAVVVMVGPFDTGPQRVRGRTLVPGTAAFAAWYGGLVEEAHSILTASGARVFWVGTPWQRASGTRERVAAVNDVFRTVASRAGSVYIDSARRLAGRDGDYREFAAGPGGRVVRWRKTDGVHLCPDGAARVASAVVSALAPVWGMRTRTAWTAGDWRDDPRYRPTIYGGGCPPPPEGAAA